MRKHRILQHSVRGRAPRPGRPVLFPAGKSTKKRPPQGPIKSSFKRGILQLARFPALKQIKFLIRLKRFLKTGQKGRLNGNSNGNGHGHGHGKSKSGNNDHSNHSNDTRGKGFLFFPLLFWGPLEPLIKYAFGRKRRFICLSAGDPREL